MVRKHIPAILITACWLCFGAGEVSAQQFVYNFINPSFLGGSSFNASWMLQLAQAQNGHQGESTDFSRDWDTDPLDDFSESLNRQILSQVSRQLMDSMFGEEGLEEGTYELGDYIIDITEGAEGVDINIRDLRDGSETSILVPYF